MDNDDALYDAAIAGVAVAIAKLEMRADILDAGGATILHNESFNGNTERVRFILREFAHKNLLAKLTKYKETALHWAVGKGHTEVAEILMDAARHLPPSDNDNPVTSFQAFLRQPDEDKHTALHLAAIRGHTEVAEILIDAARHLPPSDNDNPVTSFQAFLRQLDEDMDTALHKAVEEGHASIVKLLVEADPSDTNIQNCFGETPMYIAAEQGYIDIVKVVCTSCTALPDLDGPTPGGSTVLHAAIKNLDKGTSKEDRDVIRLMIEAVKRYPGTRYEKSRRLVELFSRTDEKRCIILELAVEENYLDVVELILAENPAYEAPQIWGIEYRDIIGIMPLIYKAKDKGYNDMVKLLTETYERGVQFVSQLATRNWKMPKLISAIGSRRQESVFSLLNDNEYVAKNLVTFADNLGWTALHHAAYHEFDSIIGYIVEAQKKFGHTFVYENMVPTPFYVAAKKGYTSTVKLLMELWPSSSSAYTAVDNNGQNILHLAALQSNKEMIQVVFKYCPEEYKYEFVNKQNKDGNTPLHLLIRGGCFVPELLKYRGLDLWVRNKDNCTPPDLLYSEVQIIGDQVQIKIALEGVQIDPRRGIFSNSVLSSKKQSKDANLGKQAEKMMREKHAGIKEDTRAFANCFADAIAGYPISKAALEREAEALNEGKTMLHVESMKGDTEHVRFIVTEFANKNILVKLDTLEQTALHLAAHHGHTQVVEVLIDAARHLPSSSANDDAHNPVSSFQDFIRKATGPMRNTALHVAVLNRNVAIVKLLVEADLNDRHVQNNEGKTPIYIAAENGYKDIVKEICTTCTALSLDGPGGRTTALHALIQNSGQVTEGAIDMIKMMVHAAKRCSAGDPLLVNFEALFSRTDESGSTVLQLAVEKNFVEAVKLILQEDPAYQPGPEMKRNGLMSLIYKAIDNNCSNDIFELLSEAYETGIPDHKGVVALILAIKRRDEDSVLGHLKDAKNLVTFKEDNGWTPLHYAVDHEFDSILGAIIEAQEDVSPQFRYGNEVSTPFHVAVKHGYTSTLIRLMQSWPPSSAVTDANSPYTVVDENRRNILHLAAAYDKKEIPMAAGADTRKEMVQSILKYCPYKDEILKQQDTNGDTPLHLLISHGCFIPELIKHEGLDTMEKNKNGFTPWDMLYSKNDVVADQVHIKIALDGVQTNQSSWNPWAKSTETKTDIWKSIPPSKRRIKDVIFDEEKKTLRDTKHEQMKKDLERYKMRTNTQIIVTALITTVTFTVGFTMPGGLRQSGEVDEGLVLLSKKTAFNAFMVSDALALLMSTLSLFFYYLESMTEDPHQVSILNASSTVLNILSVMGMMLTFIAGTYVVLSHSPAIAITVCVIGSLFFLVIIVLLMKIVYERRVKKNKD